jgi:hypothetical protein
MRLLLVGDGCVTAWWTPLLPRRHPRSRRALPDDAVRATAHPMIRPHVLIIGRVHATRVDTPGDRARIR